MFNSKKWAGLLFGRFFMNSSGRTGAWVPLLKKLAAKGFQLFSTFSNLLMLKFKTH
jgi:hypothetical protein